eukprot:GDKK01055650.1.p1 GENE.GDKK01055650.1~~GDKK01055650.1.p1  ORF type:complete len:647 (+),score=196.15 GDKK01055650.1:26-1942(+)
MAVSNNALISYIRSIISLNASCTNVAKNVLNSAPVPSSVDESIFKVNSSNSQNTPSAALSTRRVSNNSFNNNSGEFFSSNSNSSFAANYNASSSFISPSNNPMPHYLPSQQSLAPPSTPPHKPSSAIQYHLNEAFMRIHHFGQSKGAHAAQSPFDGRVLTIANPELSHRNDQLLLDFSAVISGFSSSTVNLSRLVKSEHDPRSCLLPCELALSLLKASRNCLDFLSQQINALEYAEQQVTAFFVNRITKANQNPLPNEKGPLNLAIFRDDAAVLAANVSAEFKRLRTTILCLMAVSCCQFAAVHGRISACAAEEWLEVNNMRLPDLEFDEHPVQVLFLPPTPKKMIPSLSSTDAEQNEENPQEDQGKAAVFSARSQPQTMESLLGIDNEANKPVRIIRIRRNSNSGDGVEETGNDLPVPLSRTETPSNAAMSPSPLMDTLLVEKEDGILKVMPPVVSAEDFLAVTCQHATTQTDLSGMEIEVMTEKAHLNANEHVSQFARRKSVRKSINSTNFAGADPRSLDDLDANLCMRGFGAERRETDMKGFGGDPFAQPRSINSADGKKSVNFISDADAAEEEKGESGNVAAVVDSSGRQSQTLELSSLLADTQSGTQDWLGGGILFGQNEVEEENDFTTWNYD